MSKQVSPFAELTGAEKQIRWLEYQSVRLPYVQTIPEEEHDGIKAVDEKQNSDHKKTSPPPKERSLPSQEIKFPAQEFQKTRHSQYDAVIARIKRAELQTQNYQNL